MKKMNTRFRCLTAFTLVLASLLLNGISAQAGCPAASFGPARSFLSGGADPFSIVTGDFNGDGKPDLAVANAGTEPDSSVSILLGNGDGTFQTHVDYYAGSDPDSIAVADFNGDGKLDVVVASPPDLAVWVLLGNGDGTFQPAVNYAAGMGAGRLVTGDFNGDGKPDVLVGGGSPPGFSVLLGKGDGTFQPPVLYSDGAGYFAGHVAVGDFNNDGKLDLAGDGDGPEHNGLHVFLGNGDGTFQKPVQYSLATSNAARWTAVGDLNGDGIPDLAAASAPDVVVLLGRGDGTFLPGVTYPLGGKFAAGALPSSVIIADFNVDGKPDLAVADNVGAAVSVLLGNGDGSFQPAVRFGVPTGAFSLTTADFNGDGSADLAAVADDRSFSTNGYVAVLLNMCISPPPSLSFERGNSTAIIGWPLPSTGFVLESTTNPGLANWQPVSELSITNNGQIQVTVTITPGERYFRLRRSSGSAP